MNNISICFLTIDRFELSSEILLDTINKCGVDDFEVLACDNGSKDKRIIDFVENEIPNLSYFRKNETNEGVGRMFNQLMLRAKSDYIALIGNDILMENNWGKKAIDCAVNNFIEEEGGIGAIHCVQDLPPITQRGVHESPGVFGPWIIPRHLLESIGYFCEEYFPYGLEDSDFAMRSHYKGHINYYIPGTRSIHVGHDVGENSDYRKMKDQSLKDNVATYGERLESFKRGENLYSSAIIKD